MEKKSIKGTETEKNLLKAFAGESQARNRYHLSESVARSEGYGQIADFFKQTADQERMHAKMIFSHLEGGDVEITYSYPAGGIGTTKENLQLAIDGEHGEWTDMYPSFADKAEEEGFKEIAVLLRNIMVAEKEHERLYQLFLDRLNKETLLAEEEEVVWKCRVCGFLFKGKVPPKKCPICQHPQGYYERFTDAPVI
jgi:rubrerythrin